MIGIDIYCHVLQPSPDPSNSSDQALSTAAIVMIVVGSYLALVIIALIIRQCLKVSSVVVCDKHRLTDLQTGLDYRPLFGNMSLRSSPVSLR